MQQPEEIRQRLQNWSGSPEQTEQLVVEILAAQDYSCWLRSAVAGFPLFTKAEVRYASSLFFSKQLANLDRVARNLELAAITSQSLPVAGLIFIANQELSPETRQRLSSLCPIAVEFFDLDDITAILKRPTMAKIREQVLAIRSPAKDDGTPATTAVTTTSTASKLRKQISAGSHIIKLTHLTLANFRCFATLNIELSPDLTIFVAENGQGKSTILQACQIALWPFVSSFDLAHAAASLPDGIGVDDIHLHAMPNGDLARDLPCQIAARGQVREWDDLEWQQERTSENPAEETQDGGDMAMLRSWARLLQHEIRDDQTSPLTLPVFASYGTGRLAGQQQLKRNNNEPDSPDNSFYVRTFAYRDCLAPNASYEHFSTWFKWVFKSYRETQIKNREQGLPDDTPSPWQDTIFVVQQAVDCLLRDITGWHSLEYSISHGEALILRNDQKMVMKLGQLSDGVRGMLALVGDLAYRCIKLNPHLGREAARQASGVVLIDEVDMHLHPKWQQRVVGQLRQAFPAIQFILTTHSPQVLSTVQRENIRVIQIDERGMATAEPPLAMTYGEPSGDVMQAVMEVDPQPPVAEKADLDKLTELVDSGRYEDEEATALLAHLNQRLGAQHPQLQRLQRSIRRQKALRA